MTNKQQIGLLVAIGLFWLADAAIQPSLATRISIGVLVAAFTIVVVDNARRYERREMAEAIEARADTIIDALRGIETSLRIREDPDTAHIAATFGYDAALSFPRQRNYLDYDDYIEALTKWKAGLPTEPARA